MRAILKLRGTTSTNEKIRILKNEKGERLDLLKAVFKYAYSYDKAYGVRLLTKPHPENLYAMSDMAMYNMLDLLDAILARKFSGANASHRVESFAKKYGDLIKLIIKKDLKCGVNIKLFNKVYPGTIPVFELKKPMAGKIEDCEITVIYSRVIVQPKYDGFRCLAVIENTGVQLFSAKGHRFFMPKLEQEIKNQFKYFYTNFTTFKIELDCELTYRKGLKNSRFKIASKVNSSRTRPCINTDDMQLFAFDILECSKSITDSFQALEFLPQPLTSTVLLYRLQALEVIATAAPTIIGSLQYPINFGEYYNIEKSKIRDFYNHYTEIVGYEGMLCKKLDSIYVKQRTSDWIKVKPVKDADLKCIAIEYDNEHPDMPIKSITCEGVVEGIEVVVSVGSGFSQDDRAKPGIYYLKETIEIEYDSIIKAKRKSKHDKQSMTLYGAIFKAVRFDK